MVSTLHPFYGLFSISKGSWNGKRSEKRDDFEGNGLQEIQQADRRQMEGVIKVEEMPHEAIDEGMLALLAVIEEQEGQGKNHPELDNPIYPIQGKSINQAI